MKSNKIQSMYVAMLAAASLGGMRLDTILDRSSNRTKVKRFCPNCGKEMYHQKRACSAECFEALKKAEKELKE